MKEIVSNPELVAHCGLYCGACGSYLRDRCPGCQNNAKATWCKVRLCCMEHEYASCADCKEYADPKDCMKYNNVVSKIFGFVFQSDRAACIGQIKQMGIQGHADTIAGLKRPTIKRGSR